MAFLLSCFQSKYLPWAIASSSMNNFLHADVNEQQSVLWLEGQLQLLGIVNLTTALIAGVVSSAFSWPILDSAPWTVKATFYAALLMSLGAIAAGSQQSIFLNRYGKDPASLAELQRRFKDQARDGINHLQLYIWQTPVMLLNISILLLIIGISILVWVRAVNSLRWDEDTKIAFFATIAGVFTFTNYLIGTYTLYKP